MASYCEAAPFSHIGIAEMREIQVKHEIRISNLEKEKAEGD